MTDKELRKLSRLELLELLLEVSKENESLKEKVEELKAEIQTTQNIENLLMMTSQVENALKYADSLTKTLHNKSAEAAAQSGSAQHEEAPSVKAGPLSDKEIYRSILCFFANNEDKLSVFPDDIKNDVSMRIRSLLEKRSSN